MEFDVSRVYTAVNAEELKVGSKVIVAQAFKTLKEAVKVNKEPIELRAVLPPECIARFEGSDNSCYNLAYLVEEPDVLKWTDLKVGDTVQRKGATAMVTLIDADHDMHVHINSCPMSKTSVLNTSEDDMKKAKVIIENLLDSLFAIEGDQARELEAVKEARKFLKEVE